MIAVGREITFAPPDVAIMIRAVCLPGPEPYNFEGE